MERENAAESRTKHEAEEHARARESAERSLKREAEERAIWEQLAAESESKTSHFAARLPSCQTTAQHAPKSERLDLIERGEKAATKIDLDESASTRALIDQQLRDSGWEADTKEMRYASGVRPAKGAQSSNSRMGNRKRSRRLRTVRRLDPCRRC